MWVSVTGSSMFAERICRITLVAFTAAMLSGCYFGRSTIRASDGGNYDIYADGVYLCSTDEDCSVTTRGAFGNTLFEAQKGETVAGQRSVSRDVTFASVIWMPFTYCLSLFIYQAYPDEIVIPIDQDRVPVVQGSAWQTDSSPSAASSGSSNASGGSVWDRPIY